MILVNFKKKCMKNKIIKPFLFVGMICIACSLSCTKKVDDAYLNPNASVVVPIESILPGVIGGFTAFFYNGDVNKWKKFVYGVLARSYVDLSAKANFVSSGYADSAIKYANLSMATNAENATVKVSGGNISAVNNFFGPFRGNIGALRQSSFIADLMSGNNTQAFTGIADPRRYYMLRENLNGTFKGLTPWLGNATTSNDYPKNFWGNPTPISTVSCPQSGICTIDSSRYLYQNTSPWPMMTASEIQFIIAEAAYLKGDKVTALAAYANGISLNFDMITTTYPQNVPTVFAITPASKAAYMNSVVPGVASSLTLSQIMLQKYIALYGWGVQQTWTDMRKYHYVDIDPATGNQVYAGFAPPSGANLISTNNGKLVYRCRPRYNSEYLYNIPELTRLGALALDYNTVQPWFTLP